MKISINEKLIKRNKIIAQYSLYGAIGLIVIGLFVSLTTTSKENNVTYISYLVLLPAYILMQINALLLNRWGRTPREDQFVSNALKGLDNHYSLYHYTTPVSHLLIGPGGIWIINAFHQNGLITYDDKRRKYVQKGGGNFLSKIFALDALSDIERESARQLAAANKYFAKVGIKNQHELSTANVFYHKDAKVNAKNAPELTIHIEKLKDLVRQKGKVHPINDTEIERMVKKLPEAEKY
jgi:hypothetical protein